MNLTFQVYPERPIMRTARRVAQVSAVEVVTNSFGRIALTDLYGGA